MHDCAEGMAFLKSFGLLVTDLYFLKKVLRICDFLLAQRDSRRDLRRRSRWQRWVKEVRQNPAALLVLHSDSPVADGWDGSRCLPWSCR